MAGKRVCQVRAFAKINLSLRVLGVRPDGYHELRTILQSIELHDTLTIRAVPGPFQLTCDDPECPSNSTNLIWRAAEQLWTASGRQGSPRDISIDLAKRIPLQAGLGGGSSDAAAVLRDRTPLIFPHAPAVAIFQRRTIVQLAGGNHLLERLRADQAIFAQRFVP